MEYLDLLMRIIPIMALGFAVGYYTSSKVSTLRREFLHFKIDILKYIDDYCEIPSKKIWKKKDGRDGIQRSKIIQKRKKTLS